MAEHLLHAAQISAAFNKIGRKRMTHIVRRKRGVKPCKLDTLLEKLAHGVRAHLIAARAYEEIGAILVLEKLGAAVTRIFAHGTDSEVVQGDDALFVTLAAHLDLLCVEMIL